MTWIWAHTEGYRGALFSDISIIIYNNVENRFIVLALVKIKIICFVIRDFWFLIILIKKQWTRLTYHGIMLLRAYNIKE